MVANSTVAPSNGVHTNSNYHIIDCRRSINREMVTMLSLPLRGILLIDTPNWSHKLQNFRTRQLCHLSASTWTPIAADKLLKKWLRHSSFRSVQTYFDRKLAGGAIYAQKHELESLLPDIRRRVWERGPFGRTLIYVNGETDMVANLRRCHLSMRTRTASVMMVALLKKYVKCSFHDPPLIRIALNWYR